MNDDKSMYRVAPDSSTLIFGMDIAATDLGAILPNMGRMVAGDSRTITSAMLHSNYVSRAICALFAPKLEPHNDAISVIESLSSAGFTGQVIVLAPPLLRPKMVESELRALARGMQMTLIAGAMPPLDDI